MSTVTLFACSEWKRLGEIQRRANFYMQNTCNVSRFFSPSTYLDICTLVDQMIKENWMGITTGIATEIKTMLSNSGLDASQCPQPPQSLTIDHQTIHLPEIPAALSHFAAVRKLSVSFLCSVYLLFLCVRYLSVGVLFRSFLIIKDFCIISLVFIVNFGG